jgi:hypothetical protein
VSAKLNHCDHSYSRATVKRARLSTAPMARSETPMEIDQEDAICAESESTVRIEMPMPQCSEFDVSESFSVGGVLVPSAGASATTSTQTRTWSAGSIDTPRKKRYGAVINKLRVKLHRAKRNRNSSKAAPVEHSKSLNIENMKSSAPLLARNNYTFFQIANVGICLQASARLIKTSYLHFLFIFMARKPTNFCHEFSDCHHFAHCADGFKPLTLSLGFRHKFCKF